MRLLLIFLQAALGWDFGGNQMFQGGNQNIDSFHDFLFPAASHLVHEINTGKGYSTANYNSNSAAKASEMGIKSDSKHDAEHKNERGSKGHADKEKHSKKYGEELKHKEAYGSEEEDAGEQHSSKGGKKGGFFKDRLLHKSGNYEKGYRDQYHMDEVMKQNKFWSNHDAVDKFKKFGESEAEFQNLKKEKHSEAHSKDGKEEGNNGKKGTSEDGHSAKEDKGHKSTGGTESKYEHKEEYANKNEHKT